MEGPPTSKFNIRESFYLFIGYFHSSWEVDYLKEVDSKYVEKFNSQSKETSISVVDLELSRTPPLYLVKIFVPILLTSSGWTISSELERNFGAHF